MSKRVFIIEDDVNILYGLQAKLSMEGFSVFTSNGTDEIKDIIQGMKIAKAEYVILDLVLPEVDGFELLQEIKGDDLVGQLPVFIFTNLGDKDTKEKCAQLGADQLFEKSDYNIDSFVAKITKIIENKEKIKI